MADVIVDPENKNAKELLSQGIRAYVLQDYPAAVQALGKASELSVSEHGNDLHDSLGEVYFYYGKALLALSRQESEPLGDAIPKGEIDDSEEDEEKDEEAENDANEEKHNTEKNGVENEDDSVENKQENAGETSEIAAVEALGVANGSADAVEPQGDSDEPTDLQVAWEVMELAKKIFEKRGTTDGKKHLAETLTTLGEISLENENFEAAIQDIRDGLIIQEEVFPKDSRKVAETCYNLGVAYSTNSQIDEAVESFNKSLQYLNTRISVLKKQGAGEEEIKEIEELIPELMEKIADMKTYKEETIKKLAELTKQPESASKIIDGASSSSSKQATDISHLVKRKRKTEDNEGECNPPKKISQ